MPQYLEGQRSSAWLKYKLRNSQQAVICGFTEAQGQQSGFGALVLGAYVQGKLIYIGNCGSGFKERERKEILEILAPHRRKTKPFDHAVKVAKESQVSWVEPELVCEVYFAEWTGDKHLRHPVFKGLRADKAAEDASMEIVAVNEMEQSRVVQLGRKKVTLTNQDKIYWPHEGLRKGDMLAYYEQMGNYLLPYLKDKPIAMNRFPDGIKGKSFFQKDVEPKQLPSWMKTVPMETASNKETIDYLICNDLASLLYIANLGSIEINSWLSTFKKPQMPKFGVLDLDPNGMDFQELKAVAKTCKKLLDKAEIPGFIKTSGSSGFHIYLHVNEQYDYSLVRNFIQFLAQMVHDQHPETTSLERAVKQRQGLIYLDFLQNRQGQTIAAPYSVRPKPGASVSTPIFWEELNEDIQITNFTIDSLVERLRTKADPWEAIFKTRVDIKRAITKF
ncbi:DNA ligase D [Sphingobacterium sp. DK4209]|uniref:DNA ligase (ATP) n=1 Tax=Sphingobacterium zhuxiongii TaxID=2662364 RepID=A0A5Q0QBI3_9SPHI|nr:MULTISPECIES: DNA ligase D [unclassified Sphingobacterium]MVZ67657.1 DNA ligase D [Sphingobacterium sp. DK4209]QGA26913.1 DNA ligase D [Sphingobacterium sp. dk4302]